MREHRTSSFLKVSRMFFKKHCFVVSKEPGSLLRPSLFCNSPCSSLLIGWYAMRCTFEAMGNPEEFFFFYKEATGHRRRQMIQNANLGPRNVSTLTTTVRILTQKQIVKSKQALFFINRLHLALSLCFSAKEQSCCSRSSVYI